MPDRLRTTAWVILALGYALAVFVGIAAWLDGPRLGLTLNQTSLEPLVTNVFPGGIAWDGGIRPGDVLVTSSHSEAFNAVAWRVGAIVTDTGGILSHLAIVSRELGIPCIVACKNATTAIKEGAVVRVDGDAGKVVILD